MSKMSFRQKCMVAGITVIGTLTITGGFAIYNSINNFIENKKIAEKIDDKISKPYYINIKPVEFTYKLKNTVYGKLENNTEVKPAIAVIEDNSENEFIKGYAKGIYKNKEFSKVYPEIKTVSSIKIWSWKGGKTLDKEKMRHTIRNVVSRLPYLPQSDNMVELILETAAAESDFGIAVKQYSGIAESIFQIEPATWSWCESTLKKISITSWQQLRVFYNKKDTEEFNMINNIPYSIARCATVYYIKCGNQLPHLIKTKEDRALLHKAVYNTVEGKSSVERYITMVEKHL